MSARALFLFSLSLFLFLPERNTCFMFHYPIPPIFKNFPCSKPVSAQWKWGCFALFMRERGRNPPSSLSHSKLEKQIGDRHWNAVPSPPSIRLSSLLLNTWRFYPCDTTAFLSSSFACRVEFYEWSGIYLPPGFPHKSPLLSLFSLPRASLSSHWLSPCFSPTFFPYLSLPSQSLLWKDTSPTRYHFLITLSGRRSYSEGDRERGRERERGKGRGGGKKKSSETADIVEPSLA